MHINIPTGLRVTAGCLDKAINPWEDMCSGRSDNEIRAFQCCDTPLCNEAFYNGPFPTSPPTVEITAAPDNSTAGITQTTDKDVSSGSEPFSTTPPSTTMASSTSTIPSKPTTTINAGNDTGGSSHFIVLKELPTSPSSARLPPWRME